MLTTFEDLQNEQLLPVIIANHLGIVTHVNEPFVAVFGWSSLEIVGQPLATIIPPTLREAHQQGFSRFLTTNESRLLGVPLRLKAVRKDGQIFDAEHLILGKRHGSGWLFAATIRPVTPRIPRD